MTQEILKKKIHAVFFCLESGREPVRDFLKELGRPIKTSIGEDIRFVELNWKVDRPYVDQLIRSKSEFKRAIYEVRHRVEGKEYRTLFFVYKNLMILVHGFHKTTQKTPKSAVDLARKRMRNWMNEQRVIEGNE